MTDNDAVLAADDARLNALIAGDFDALDRLLAADLVFVHTKGERDDKKTYLDSLRSGRIRYRAITRSETSVKVTGDVGILCGAVTLHATIDNDNRSMPVRYMSVWARHAGGWQLLAIDTSRVSAG